MAARQQGQSPQNKNQRPAQKQNNIRKYRRPINVNLGMLIFGAIFVYVVIGVFLFFTSDHIRFYEVQMGSLAVSNIYQGIALREEETVTGADSGYVNYYAREGQRVGCGNLVYTIDESGRIAELIAGYEGDSGALTESDLKELKTEFVGFSHEFRETDCGDMYDFKYNVQGMILKLANNSILSAIDSMDAASSELVKRFYAPKSGIIVYSTDGYEGKQAADITMADFDQSNYQKTQLISNELSGSGDAVYKLSLSENWSIVVPVEDGRLAELVEEEYVKVRFLKNQQESWAQVKAVTGADGETYAELLFNNSMITFCTDRFIDLELITNDETGLKIPNSAIVEKEFFLIPLDYVTKGGNNDNPGVLRQSYLEDGTATTEFIETTVYNKTDTEYYLDNSALRIGDYLVKPDSTETYPVSKRGTLIGVYNINKGYADFKQILILYQNEEYSIVQSGTDYGLNAYDHIALDAAVVNENDLIYE